jgi:hypothetical protein
MKTSIHPGRIALGVVVLAMSLVVGCFVVRQVVRIAFPERPHAEAYEGFGEAMFAWYGFLFGTILWAVVSLAAAVRVVLGTREIPPTPSPAETPQLPPPRSA